MTNTNVKGGRDSPVDPDAGEAFDGLPMLEDAPARAADPADRHDLKEALASALVAMTVRRRGSPAG